MKYACWVVKCQTPGCPAVHVAKLIGIHDNRPIYFLPDKMPGRFAHECDRCGTVHTYTRDSLELGLLDSPPPPEFDEWW